MRYNPNLKYIEIVCDLHMFKLQDKEDNIPVPYPSVIVISASQAWRLGWRALEAPYPPDGRLREEWACPKCVARLGCD